jgi:signal transduction histidine kinase
MNEATPNPTLESSTSKLVRLFAKLDWLLPDSIRVGEHSKKNAMRLVIWGFALGVLGLPVGSFLMIVVFSKNTASLALLLAGLACVGVLLWNRKFGSPEKTAVVYTVAMTSVVLATALMTAGALSSGFKGQFLIVIVAFLVGGYRVGWFAVALSCAAVWVVVATHANGMDYDLAHYVDKLPRSAAFTLPLLYVFAGLLVGYYEKSKSEAEASARVARRALETARDEAIAQNQIKSQFLANMSHELRTPLNAIIGYSELLEEELEDLDEAQLSSDATRIQRAGRHLLSLLNDILDSSKLEAGKLELFLQTFSVEALLIDVRDTTQALVQKNGNEFVLDWESESLGTMHADQLRVKQILLNLLSNAAKFTDDAKVTLRVRKSDAADSFMFEVIDEGIGMTPPQLEKLFVAYEQADESIASKFGGTGLGLSICRQLCQLMRGEISVESQPGEGTTFRVELPARVVG